MSRFRVLHVPALALALTGCKLIDQTTFAPDQEPAPSPAAIAAAAPTAPAGRVALVSIRFDQSSPPYQDQLAFAVRTVEQRRPGSEYDVVGVSTAADAARTGQDSTAIMEAMVKQGIAASRIRLGARIDPAQTVREVRVYLR